jgi:small-conductance mechanosensitive channel
MSSATSTIATPRLLAELVADIEPFGLGWELLVLAVAYGLGAWAAYRLRRRLTSHEAPVEASTELVLPAVAVVVTYVGQLLLGRFEPVPLLKIMQVFALTWLIVRGSVGLVLKVFPDAPGLRLAAGVAKWLMWIVGALYVAGWLKPLTEYLDSVVLPFGKPPVSVQALIEATLSIVVTLLAALWVSQAIEARLMGAQVFELNHRLVLGKLTRAALLLVAVLIALSFAGIPLTALGVFGGALGVGLGLGLQKLAANYVSGFVILLDGSIRVGDFIRIEGFEGQVSAIRTRYTIVKALNGRESIVPNEVLVNGRVENLSLENRNISVSLVLNVAYESDVDRALAILKEVAAEQPRVLKEPAPGAMITAFAADAFELSLFFWINDPENGQLALRGAIFREVWRRFQAEGIEVPYPQRVLRYAAPRAEQAGAPA